MIFDWPSDPAWRPMSGLFRLRALSQVSVSPYSGAVKAVGFGLVWAVDLTFNNHELTLGHDIQGFIDGLEGSVNPVRLFDWWRPMPRLLESSVSGFSDGTFFTDGTGFTDGTAPLVVAATLRGQRQVVLQGLPVSQPCFSRGDLIGIGGFLYQVKSGVSSNAAGQVLVNILPGLRSNIGPGDPVVLWRPKITLRLLPGADVIPRSFHTSDPFTLSFVEDIP